MAAELVRVSHGFGPVYDGRSRALVLGTMPSPASREVGFYYGHPRNRFWPVVASLFGEVDPGDPEGRRDLALRHGIALWDVLAECDVRGAADSSIARPVANDLGLILGASPIRQVFVTGKTALRLYRRLCEPLTHMPATCLPSTSPANAAWRLDDLVIAYAPLRECVVGQDASAEEMCSRGERFQEGGDGLPCGGGNDD